MTTKIKVSEIVSAMKKAISTVKPLTSKPMEKLTLSSNPRERDMRQEAMDMGSHGANEYFGESKT